VEYRRRFEWAIS